MAVQTRSRRARKASSNGSPNGHINGYANANANGHANGHAEKKHISAAAPRPTKRKPRRSLAGAFTSIIARLVTWYTLITLLFRCPSSLTQINNSSPRVCEPYLRATSYATPYLEPYYQIYVTPHVERLKPYTDRFDDYVYTPAATFTKDTYATYAADRVESATQFAEAQYHQSILPQLQNAQQKITTQYQLYLEPHVKTASDAAAPYYEQTKASLEEMYELSVLPAYEASLPHLHRARVRGHHLLVYVVYPHVTYARDTTWAFLVRTVWPQVRVLYGDNVEPQLVRISERLGRYRDQQRMESLVEVQNSRTEVPTAGGSSASAASPESATKAGWGVFDDFFGGDSKSAASDDNPSEASQPAEPKLTEAELREKLNQDLRLWQTKFATAADKGAEDLQQRVTEITKRQVNNAVNGHGRALVVKLEATADSTIAKLKDLVKKTVKSIPEDAPEEHLELAYQELGTRTREYGLTVKERAQDIRAWKAAYDEETDSLVQAAVSSTVDVLEKIHGLGLQEVGMRWAWTDGVTYKDWQNYHKLRETLNEWQAEVEAVGAKHEGLRVAHEAAKKLEDEAMTIASNMVTELVRLKNVSKWKIWTGDATDDFSEKKIPVRVLKAAQQVKDSVEEAASQVSEAIQGSSTPLTESIASSVKSVVSEASSQVSAAAEKIASKAPAANEPPKKAYFGANAQILAEARQVILDEPLDDDDDDETYSEKLQDMAADAGERAAELSRIVSQAILGQPKTTGNVESMSSLASEQYSKAFAAASSVIYGTEQRAVESATSVASEKFAQAMTAASYAIYGTPRPTAIIRSIRIQASSRYNDAVHVASEQLEIAKSQLSLLVSGKPKPAHETMLSYFERAYSDSVAAASERLSAALQYTETVKNYAAGPTQGYFESVSSIASSRLAEAISQASNQFSPAQPTGAVDSARRQYYEAIGLAHARYSEFVDTASSAVYGPPQGSVKSLASIASASAASAASVVSVSAKSAAANAQGAAKSIASSASSAVVGTETSWHESVASEASRNWESLIAQASSQVYGKPTPWLESAYSQAGAYGAQATAAAGQQYADIQALMSELLVGKEAPFTESVMKRFSSAYNTGVPAAMASAQSYASQQAGSVGSLASEGYEAVTNAAADAYASASSAVSAVFTPPAAVEDALSQASASLDQAIESASIAIYGTPKGAAERASESIESAYSSIQSQLSGQVYGTQNAYDSFALAAKDAQAKISEAIFGTPTAGDYVASATSGAAGAYSSVSSAVNMNAQYAASVASSAIYGPEQGAVESANSRLAAALEVATSKINEMYSVASKSAASAAAQATKRVKDEL